jgi:hypothetical protein
MRGMCLEVIYHDHTTLGTPQNTNMGSFGPLEASRAHRDIFPEHTETFPRSMQRSFPHTHKVMPKKNATAAKVKKKIPVKVGRPILAAPQWLP